MDHRNITARAMAGAVDGPKRRAPDAERAPGWKCPAGHDAEIHVDCGYAVFEDGAWRPSHDWDGPPRCSLCGAEAVEVGENDEPDNAHNGALPPLKLWTVPVLIDTSETWTGTVDVAARSAEAAKEKVRAALTGEIETPWEELHWGKSLATDESEIADIDESRGIVEAE